MQKPGVRKCGKMGLQSVLGVELKSVAKWITKCVRDYKARRGRLQSVTGITKCSGITN